MALRPKLEFYRFNLVSKSQDYKTFRDFAIEELYQRRPSSNAQIMNKLFEHFMNELVTEKAKDRHHKKQLKLIKTASNKFLCYKPQVDVENNIIYGVINGGRFGRNGMMSDASAAAEDASSFGKDKTILRYYYFLLYLPLDHNEGCFIIHSNSKEETITDMFKLYLSRLFKRGNYKELAMFLFCPRSFQREFEEQATIKSVEFKDTYLDDIYTEQGISSQKQLYDVEIKITPKNGKLSLNEKGPLKKLLQRLSFCREEKGNDKITGFKSKRMTLKSPFSKSDRTFDLDEENLNVIPVVYLEGRIEHYNDDDTPDFEELNKLCQNLFQDEVLPELRPDNQI